MAFKPNQLVRSKETRRYYKVVSCEWHDSWYVNVQSVGSKRSPFLMCVEHLKLIGNNYQELNT